MLPYVEDDGRDSCTLWLIVCVQGPRAEITDGCFIVVALVSLVWEVSSGADSVYHVL